jgi:hypothetical protein
VDDVVDFKKELASASMLELTDATLVGTYATPTQCVV